MFIDTVFAQTYTGVLILDPIPSQVQTGEKITFSGIFQTSSGEVIPFATITIKDDVTAGSDDVIKIIQTDENGKFVGTWTAEPRSSGAWDFYATYAGSNNISSARSETYSVTVSDHVNPNSNSPSSKIPTNIIFDNIPSSIYAGQIVTFTGKLTSNNQPVSNALVKIMEDDPLSPDQLLVTGKTDSDGRFEITWQVSKGYFETDFDTYAVFDGDSNFLRVKSPNQIMSVLRYSGSISLDPLPHSVNVGDVVTFSGKLELNQGSPEMAIVYIKDEDPLSKDDLLATTYVDKNGRFAVNWIAKDVDADGEADIYAVFEGNDVLYRLTTCDNAPTMDYGSSCTNTIKLPIHYSSSLPPTTSTTSEEYMGLYYSLDFTGNPHIAIVPNPDSYNDGKSYIIPAEEGILMWTSDLTNKYGGNWNVDFEVISPGKIRFDSKPDVVINLVTPEQDSNCNDVRYGAAYITPIPMKPIQAWVCVSSSGQNLSQSQVSATSAHEFIHMVGLGHAWNKKGDLMCSREQGKDTCPNSAIGNSKTPSDLNLAGVVRLYGTDGFRNPNYVVSYNSKYPDSSQPITNITPNQKLITIDSDNDGISDINDKCPLLKETYNNYLDDDGCSDTNTNDSITEKNQKSNYSVEIVSYDPKIIDSTNRRPSARQIDIEVKLDNWTEREGYPFIEIYRGVGDVGSSSEQKLGIIQMKYSRSDGLNSFFTSRYSAPLNYPEGTYQFRATSNHVSDTLLARPLSTPVVTFDVIHSDATNLDAELSVKEGQFEEDQAITNPTGNPAEMHLSFAKNLVANTESLATIQLVDSAGNPAYAKKDVLIKIISKDESILKIPKEITIKKGEYFNIFKLKLQKEGKTEFALVSEDLPLSKYDINIEKQDPSKTNNLESQESNNQNFISRLLNMINSWFRF